MDCRPTCGPNHLGLWFNQDWLFYVLEYCPGGEFFQLMKKQPHGRLVEASAKFYVCEVVLALEYLHMKGFLYRDMKPENILIGHDGDAHQKRTPPPALFCVPSKSVSCNTSGKAAHPQVLPATRRRRRRRHTAAATGHIRLTDFDLSRDNSAAKPGAATSKEAVLGFDPSTLGGWGGGMWRGGVHGVVEKSRLAIKPAAGGRSFVGTIEYIPPEVILGREHTPAVDWWIVGVLCYELLHSVTPFRGHDERSTFENILYGTAFP